MTERLYAATRKGLFAIERGIAGWRVREPWFLGDAVSAVLPDARDGTLYAALNLGHFGVKMRRSRDGGTRWEEHAVPAYPPQPDDLPAEAAPWTLAQVWVLEAGGADEPGVLWAGTHPGGLFRSGDGGDAWTLNDALWRRPERSEWFGGGYDTPGIHSICVDPRDSRVVTLAISCGGVWRSLDGGGSWTLVGRGMQAPYMPPERSDDPNIQDVHRMVACTAAPDVFWVQHHGGVYRSEDGARTFEPVREPALSAFGFAVAVDPCNRDTAWFVPAAKDEARVPVGGRLAVTRTRDGGRSFEVLHDGLPPAPAYDLVYRHALAVDASGERLAIGSTTGGLWVSEDRGEHWRCVCAHLPPIYALRFDA